MNPKSSFSNSVWPRRYLTFGPILAIVQIVLYFGLFIIGIGMSDSGPLTPGKTRDMGVISVLIIVMGYPLYFFKTGGFGGAVTLIMMVLNALIWGLSAVGIWHAFSVIGKRSNQNEAD